MDSPANADSKFWMVLISGRAIFIPFLYWLVRGVKAPWNEFWTLDDNQSSK
jgi:hypothetical protein